MTSIVRHSLSTVEARQGSCSYELSEQSDFAIGNTCQGRQGTNCLGHLRQVQIAVENALKIARHICYMNPDDTVVCLAGVAAPLPADSSGVRTFLGISRIIDDSDSRWMGMFIGLTNTFDLCNIHIDSAYKHCAHKKLSTSPSRFLELCLRCSTTQTHQFSRKRHGKSLCHSNIAQCVIPAKLVLDSDLGAGIHSPATPLDTCFRRYDKANRSV